MAAKMSIPKSESSAGGVGVAGNDFGGFGEEGRGGSELTPPFNTAQLGLWALLATLGMLFAGFTSAYLVRRAGADWHRISMPPILWLNTALLLSSSVTLEVARARMRRWQLDALKGWLLLTASLGVAFLAGQLFAWRKLAAQGVYVATNPHSSFFYMLTGVHGMHLLGGVGALLYALGRVWRFRWTPGEPNSLDLCAIYWHFVDGLWLYLLLVMFVW